MQNAVIFYKKRLAKYGGCVYIVLASAARRVQQGKER